MARKHTKLDRIEFDKLSPLSKMAYAGRGFDGKPRPIKGRVSAVGAIRRQPYYR